MKFAVVSDVHIGSKYFRSDRFMEFVRGLPTDVGLVLNGDTMDRLHARKFRPGHREALDLLRRESFRRPVVWVYGNHDENYRMPDPGRIEFRKSFSIGRRLFVAHGYDFDNVMPYHRCFVRVFRILHEIRIWLGAEAVHVAHYAKKWPFLYRVLLKNVLMNAVEYARENGYEAVACGHTHYVEDVTVDGIRYINTGAWTEPPLCYLMVDDQGARLVEFRSTESGDGT
jgi:UDP-2,3-diacylglucosamine pyrophosphatase LpxH